MSDSVLKGIEDEFDRIKHKNVARLKKRKLPYDELLDLAATFMSVYDEEAKAHQRTILSMKEGAAQINEYAENLPEEIAKILLNERSERARLAAIALHSQTGGSHDKQESMRKVWATGKYKSRTQCAEKEHENFGMSLATAIKALRNTPDPKNRAFARKG